MADTLMLALSNADLPPLRDWQRAVDAWQPLLPVEFSRIDAGREGACEVRIADRSFGFTCTALPVSAVVSARHPDLTSRWAFACGFRGVGRVDGWISGAISAIARVMYAIATGGALYHQDIGAFRDFSSGRDRVDAVFAQEFDAWGLYAERHPDGFPDGTVGPRTIEVRLRSGG